MTEEGSVVVQGPISVVAVAFLQAAVLRMIPYSIPAVFLIILDLDYGVMAARYRGERVRVSTAVRRTATKIFSYICWIVIASTLALSFGRDWIEWGVLGLVYLNEISSIISNYLETKGLELSLKTLFNWVLKIFGQKTNIDTEGMDVGDLVKPKPKPERDPKTGRFVKSKSK